MTYSLGEASLKHLVGVHPDLARVVHAAIIISAQDFNVHEGLRTLDQQRAYVRAGTSKTMHSRHLGGFAVDLVPVIGGVLRWQWGAIYPIAAAMRAAAIAENVPIRWGGVWDRRLADLPQFPAGIKMAVEDYCKRHPGPDFLDGPHFELPEES